MRYAMNALKATALALPLSLGAATAHAADLVQTIQESGSLTTFYQALQQANMLDALRDEQPDTVFAPTDAAFAALPDATVDALFAPENRDALRTLLGYHIVQGRAITSAELPERVQTMSGQLFVGLVEGAPVLARSEAHGASGAFPGGGAHVQGPVATGAGGEADIIQDAETTAADELQDEAPMAQAQADEATTGTVGQQAAGEEETLTELMTEGERGAAAAPQQPTAAPGTIQDPEATSPDELQDEEPLRQERAEGTATGLVGQQAAGEEETITEYFGAEPEEGVRFERADLEADNGVVHVIDYVLVPNAVIEEMLR